ncbi:peptidoglycan DD-metalloendopeptidase family protein [Thermosulfurimonas sp. F29]|uniref:peptidoglycan DD-metalloendopeptidase family protein n=1 Tax=Thermosulfurimonas sp. F29 TaxID=2867247 RepID=UPI001C830149|nr:peptidoglycan DD-metalloendopeptidase family protein [Thermosulfurimonas sp. F29]MBX6422140.1 peptidoglycan DD-metalloendopeptidase family protein [Thermosulfurimonas sp. F29]
MKRYLHLIILSDEKQTRRISIPVSLLRLMGIMGLLWFVLGLVGLFSVPEIRKLREKRLALETKIRDLEKENRILETKIAALKKEKQELLAGAVGELKARSKVIEKLVSDLGLKRYLPEARKNYRGGPLRPGKLPEGEGGIYVPLSENYQDLITTVDAYLGVLSRVPIGRPCPGYISSGFGRRRDPFTGKPAFHTGIDLVSYPGTPVRSTADGKVVYAGRHSGYGKVVVIRHGYGYSTLYGHLQKITVRAGQKVKRGQIIGYLGNTGRSTGPHLHYEVRRYGRYLNPYRYIRIRLSRGEKVSK